MNVWRLECLTFIKWEDFDTLACNNSLTSRCFTSFPAYVLNNWETTCEARRWDFSFPSMREGWTHLPGVLQLWLKMRSLARSWHNYWLTGADLGRFQCQECWMEVEEHYCLSTVGCAGFPVSLSWSVCRCQRTWLDHISLLVWAPSATAFKTSSNIKIN